MHAVRHVDYICSTDSCNIRLYKVSFFALAGNIVVRTIRTHHMPCVNLPHFQLLSYTLHIDKDVGKALHMEI